MAAETPPPPPPPTPEEVAAALARQEEDRRAALAHAARLEAFQWKAPDRRAAVDYLGHSLGDPRTSFDEVRELVARLRATGAPPT